jgi:alpha-ketoglutarate-dependent taurine dioxygenase
MSMSYAAEYGWPTARKRGWAAADFDATAATITLDGRVLDLLMDLVEQTKSRGTAVTDITREQFDHPELHDLFGAWVQNFKNGQGLLIFRGFPVRDLPLDDIWRMYWGIGTHFGRAVSQNTHGHVQGVVAVQPGVVSNRVYGTATVAPLHSDRIDMLTLLCVNKAKRGGENVFASSLKVWDIIEEERPDLLQLLMRGYPQRRNGEEPEGCSPVTPYRVPVFGEVNGLRSAYYGGNASRSYQETQFAEILTDADREALDFLAEVVQRPEIAIQQTLEPGEAVFINNMEMLHSRTAFEDGSEPHEKRMLLRLWLEGRPIRPIPQDMRVIHNPTGELGILPKKLSLAAAQ